jgi:hypothetical protein
MDKILVGCDPEVFVKKSGIFQSAHGLILGDKKNPFPVRNGAVQVDGMALEFNIHPAASEEEFIFNVEDVYSQMRSMVPEYEVVATPVAHFTEEYIASQPPAALELGCDPDFNGWDMRINKKPNANRPMRTASGHVHIGWTSGENINDADHFELCGELACQMDFYLGLGSLFYDEDQERRSMYGNPGCFRPKSYGVEYRTLSNKWLNDRKLMGWVYRQTVQGTKDFFSGRILKTKHGDIQNIIASNDKKEARKIIMAEKLEMAHA